MDLVFDNWEGKVVDANLRLGLIVLAFMLLGLVVTGIEKVAYDSGYVIDELMQSPSTITLADLMIITMVMFTLLGAVIAVVSNR